MNERERPHQGNNPGGSDPGLPAGGGNLEGVRQRATAFFAAADDAINNALSGDSTKFNQAARQEGGE
jgi:hypothetical protein